jgi:hypothetical protein
MDATRRPGRTVGVACNRVGRGVDFGGSSLLLETQLGTDEVRVEVVEADRHVASGEEGNERLVLRAEAGQHVAEQLLISERHADGRH